ASWQIRSLRWNGAKPRPRRVRCCARPNWSRRASRVLSRLANGRETRIVRLGRARIRRRRGEEVIMFQRRSSALAAGPARLLRLACLAMPLALPAGAGPATREFVARARSFFDDASFAPSTEPIDPG